MLYPTDVLDEDCVIASNLKPQVFEELGDDVVLDETTVDALVRGILVHRFLGPNHNDGINADTAIPHETPVSRIASK